MSAPNRIKLFALQSSFIYRHYSKNVLRRRPVRILNVPETVTSMQQEKINAQLIANEVKNYLELPTISDQKMIVPSYEKLQPSDARFTKTLTFIKSRKLREEKKQILLEGKRLINDAISAGVRLETIYFSREEDLASIQFKDQRNAEIYKVLYKQLQLWSELKTCPGVMGVFKQPTVEDLHILSEPAIPVTVICDNIREPGNLGSVIRNAAAAGCESILLMKGCVDPWEVKVLRAGCGGHFRIPIINNIEWSHILNYIPSTSKIFVADNTIDIDNHGGDSEFVYFDEQLDDENDEKLNAKNDEQSDTENEDDVKKYATMSENDQPIVVDETYEEPAVLERYEDIVLPGYLYSSIKYPKKDIVLYVGGETHGVDTRINKLACDLGGKKLKIPLENGMESLNSAFALTLILYEIKRQLKEVYVGK